MMADKKCGEKKRKDKKKRARKQFHTCLTGRRMHPHLFYYSRKRERDRERERESARERERRRRRRRTERATKLSSWPVQYTGPVGTLLVQYSIPSIRTVCTASSTMHYYAQ